MHTYLNQLRKVLREGNTKDDRTNTGTISTFGLHASYDLTDGQIPLLTTKSIHFRSVLHELIWMLSGNTNVQYLRDNGVTIWDEWADSNGELGRVYGAQWRHWLGANLVNATKVANGEVGAEALQYFKGVDQIEELMAGLRDNPWDRGHIVTAWNPAEFDSMALRPCHAFFQFNLEKSKETGETLLSCQMYQRSADMFLGVPFNIAFYSLLTHMVAHSLGVKAHKFHHCIGDAHIYSNHIEQVKQQLEREPTSEIVRLKNFDDLITKEEGDVFRDSPDLELHGNFFRDLTSFKAHHIELQSYNPQPKISAPVAI